MVGTLFAAADPYRAVRIPLPRATEIGRKEVAVLQLGDGRGMGRIEWSILIEELIAQNFRVLMWN